MIYRICHRECETPKIEGYKDLYVGDLCNYLDEDNINYLNPFLNEATGMYYIWKNCNDEIKGQIQYRKHLSDNGEALSYDKIKELLNEYDIVTTTPYAVGNGIYLNLRSEIGNDINKKTLDKYYYKLCEIEPELKEYFNTTSFSPGNMFACRKEIYDNYCEWVFSIMIPLTKQFIKEDMKINNKNRFMAYIFERLLTYWVKKNNLKIITFDYKITGDRLPVTEVKNEKD